MAFRSTKQRRGYFAKLKGKKAEIPVIVRRTIQKKPDEILIVVKRRDVRIKK